jgi:hypothetical protein
MRRTTLAMLLLAVWVLAARGEEPATDRAWNGLWRLYERAREAGDDVPGDIYEWAREDLGRVGDWQYRVVELPDAESAALETTLGKFGESRWEVFWIERQGRRLRLYLKRPARSYLGSVPTGQLMRMLPDGAE